MKEKAFTLIELLAVIVILAIIALIAVPIIMGIINDTKISSLKSSANGYLSAVTNSVALKNANQEFNPHFCTGESGDQLTCYDIDDNLLGTLNVSVDNALPINVRIYFDNNRILVDSSLELELSNYIITGDENENIVLTLIGSSAPCYYAGTLEVGTEVVCGTEHFYVIENPEGETVKLLSEKNISLDTLNPVQSDEPETIVFQTTNYTGEYDSNTNLYPYVEAYKNNTLRKIGLKDIVARLPYEDEIWNLPHIYKDLRVLYMGEFWNNYIEPIEIPDEYLDMLYGSTDEEIYEFADSQFEGLGTYLRGTNFTRGEQGKLILFISQAPEEMINEFNMDQLTQAIPYWAAGQSYYLGNAEEIFDYLMDVDNLGYYVGETHHGSPNGIRPLIEVNKSYLMKKNTIEKSINKIIKNIDNLPFEFELEELSEQEVQSLKKHGVQTYIDLYNYLTRMGYEEGDFKPYGSLTSDTGIVYAHFGYNVSRLYNNRYVITKINQASGNVTEYELCEFFKDGEPITNLYDEIESGIISGKVSSSIFKNGKQVKVIILDDSLYYLPSEDMTLGELNEYYGGEFKLQDTYYDPIHYWRFKSDYSDVKLSSLFTTHNGQSYYVGYDANYEEILN